MLYRITVQRYEPQSQIVADLLARVPDPAPRWLVLDDSLPLAWEPRHDVGGADYYFMRLPELPAGATLTPFYALTGMERDQADDIRRSYRQERPLLLKEALREPAPGPCDNCGRPMPFGAQRFDPCPTCLHPRGETPVWWENEPEILPC